MALVARALISSSLGPDFRLVVVADFCLVFVADFRVVASQSCAGTSRFVSLAAAPAWGEGAVDCLPRQRQRHRLARVGYLIDRVADAAARIVVATLHCGLLVQVPQAIEDIVTSVTGGTFFRFATNSASPQQVVDVGGPGPSAEPATSARKVPEPGLGSPRDRRCSQLPCLAIITKTINAMKPVKEG